MQNPASLPEPLRGNELGTFAHHSVAVRLPAIAARVPGENELSPASVASLGKLIGEIANGVITALPGRGPSYQGWDSYVAPHVGETWLNVPWFFAEYYFYRRLLDAVDYWDTGSDPFRAQKRLGLDQALPAARETMAKIDAAYARGVSTDFLLLQLTDAALWGNRIDLSLWPAERGGAAEPDEGPQQLLVDDRPAAIRSLHDRIPPIIDIVIDNAGSELVADLMLADLLLRSDLASSLRLHAKEYPIFVSDATPRDVAETTRHLAADSNPHLRSAGERLRIEFASGRLQVAHDPFWVSPLGWRQRPHHLNRQLGEGGLILVKGDANYRRLLDDRHWDPTTPFGDAIGSTPAPLLALRTLKSEIVSGLEPGTVESAAEQDPDWMQNGRWALASFAPEAS